MNKNLSKALPSLYLVYCVIFSLFITVAGIVMYKKSEGIFFQILFLPVTIFFVLTLISKMKRVKTKTQEPSIQKPHRQKKVVFFTVVLVIFLVLLMIALANVMGNQKQ